MKARDLFEVNQAVVATPRFYQVHKRYRTRPRPITGIVRGFSTTGYGVRVQIDGQTTVARYPLTEWEPQEDAS